MENKSYARVISPKIGHGNPAAAISTFLNLKVKSKFFI